MRFGALQDCPELVMTARTPSVTAVFGVFGPSTEADGAAL
jgi:hypothetical protein